MPSTRTSYNLTFKPSENILPLKTTLTSPFTSKPRVAILREEGVNGQAEMAFAFHQAGFSAIDVHMTDIISNRVSLAGFVGLAACGGFSYGDVLGAGQGWAKSVLLHPNTRKEFQTFFERPDTFALGVCNGCQFMSKLKELIPGAELWPSFERNVSEQYEACMACMALNFPLLPLMVRVKRTSLLLRLHHPPHRRCIMKTWSVYGMSTTMVNRLRRIRPIRMDHLWVLQVYEA
jgi:phosphoribosylformylglycinamidine synthase